MANFNIWMDIPESYRNFSLVPKDHADVADQVLKALHGTPGLSREQIFSKAKKRKQNVTNALRHLIRLKIIRRSGEGKRNSPFVYHFD